MLRTENIKQNKFLVGLPGWQKIYNLDAVRIYIQWNQVKINQFIRWINQNDIFVRIISNLSKRKHINFRLSNSWPSQLGPSIKQEASNVVSIQIQGDVEGS